MERIGNSVTAIRRPGFPGSPTFIAHLPDSGELVDGMERAAT
jgi:hypothetical protein